MTYLFPQECTSSILFQRTAPLGASAQNDGLGCSSAHQGIRRCLGAPVLPSAGRALLVEFFFDSVYELWVLLYFEPNTCTRALYTTQTHTRHTYADTDAYTSYTSHEPHTHSRRTQTHTRADTYAIHTIYIMQTCQIHHTHEHTTHIDTSAIHTIHTSHDCTHTSHMLRRHPAHVSTCHKHHIHIT